MSLVQQQKDCSLPDRQERRREVVLNPNSNRGGSGDDCVGGSGGGGNDSFFDRLRTQLLRVRVARLLRQDFALGKQLAELKALCDEVSTVLGTDAFQELWAVVSRQGRFSGPQGTVRGPSVTTASATHLGQVQDSSLAQDAGIVSLARELLLRAAGVANNSYCDNSNANNPVRNRRSSHEWNSCQLTATTACNPLKGPPVLPSSFFSFRGHDEGRQSPAEVPPRHDFESRDDPLTRKSKDNTIITPLPPVAAPAPAPGTVAPAAAPVATASIRSSPDAPPLLASKVGAKYTVKQSCVDFAHAEKRAAAAAAASEVDAANKTRFVQTGDQRRAVDGLAIWPRNEGGVSLQPKPLLNTSPSWSERVGSHYKNGKGGAQIIEETPRSPAGDDVGPRDEPGGRGGFNIKLSARGAQTVTVCLNQCPSRLLGERKQAVNTAAAALSTRHAVDGSRGVTDGDLDRARSLELLTRPAESKDKRPTLRRSEEGVHHQDLRRVPPDHRRPQMSTQFCEEPPPRLPPSPQAPLAAEVARVPQKDKSFGENFQGKIGPQQQPWPARSRNFGTGAKTNCEDIRDVAPPISVLSFMETSASLRSYINDPPRGDTQVLERVGCDDSRVPCMKPSSVKFVARNNVGSPRTKSGGGDAGRCPCCRRLGNGYQNEQHITGAPQREPETANSLLTASPSGTTTIQKEAVHPAGYRRRYGQRDNSGETRERDASDKKTERQRLQSADSNTYRRNREVSPARQRLPSVESTESYTETAGTTAIREDDSSSCTLARKRALVRVRLARQRSSLATAVADANERAFRAERRRKREENIAVLLLKTFGGGAVDGSRHVERRPSCCEAENNDREGGGGGECDSSPAGLRFSRTDRKENRATKGVAFAVSSVPRSSHQDAPLPPDGDGTPRPPHGGGLRHKIRSSGDLRPLTSPIFVVAEGGREEEECEGPRQPLKVVPIKARMPGCRLRSTWRADNDQRRLSSDAPAETTQQDVQYVDSHPAWARFSGTMSSSSPLVVFLDALRALPGRRSYFYYGLGWDGDEVGGDPFTRDEPCVQGAGVFLVLEAGRLKHQTAVRPPARAAINVCRATTTEREQGGGGGRNAWAADWRRSPIAEREVADDKWVFRETVVLQSTETVGREPALVENRLRVRVYARDMRLAHEKSVVAAEKDHRLVGVATLPLHRLVVSGVLGDDSSKHACKCTFSRPVKVSVLTLEGVAIGWLGLSICGGWKVLGCDHSGD